MDDTRSALQFALELQDKMIEIQGDLQRLIRALADENSHESSLITAHEVEKTVILSNNSSLSLVDLDHGDYRFTKPRRVHLPDGSSKQVKAWKEVVVEIVGWMIGEGYIIDDVPVTKRRKYPLVSKVKDKLSKNHGNPESYIAEYESWWIDTWGNVNRKARNLIAICRSVDVDPSDFVVVLRQG
ncbi:MAG: hypothetical protein P1P76_06445 [Anaerolineales bacterium]|nr:hypothetical protein [Anaerolineales bacterium]